MPQELSLVEQLLRRLPVARPATEAKAPPGQPTFEEQLRRADAAPHIDPSRVGGVRDDGLRHDSARTEKTRGATSRPAPRADRTRRHDDQSVPPRAEESENPVPDAHDCYELPGGSCPLPRDAAAPEEAAGAAGPADETQEHESDGVDPASALVVAPVVQTLLVDALPVVDTAPTDGAEAGVLPVGPVAPDGATLVSDDSLADAQSAAPSAAGEGLPAAVKPITATGASSTTISQQDADTEEAASIDENPVAAALDEPQPTDQAGAPESNTLAPVASQSEAAGVVRADNTTAAEDVAETTAREPSESRERTTAVAEADDAVAEATENSADSGGAGDDRNSERPPSERGDQPSVVSPAQAAVPGGSNRAAPANEQRTGPSPIAASSNVQGPRAERSALPEGPLDRPLSDVERTRMVERVVRAVQVAAERGEPLRLRLTPPSLGPLNLEVTVRSGAMSVQVEAVSSRTRDLLLESLPQLRERLAEQKVRLERFEVDIPSGGGRNPAEQFADPRSYTPPPPPSGGRRGPDREAPPASAAPSPLIGPNSINIVV